MSSVRRSLRVHFTAAQMFDLVADVESYPEFLLWCRGARMCGSTSNTVDAEIDVGIAGIRKSFRTRNTLDRPHSISIALLSGPFRRLDGAWTFADLAEGRAEVALALDFEVVHSPLAFAFAAIFEEVARSQLSAFVGRAEQVYG
jgi:ribosome-associated toxin RatA of RatAB toxin-antitoxin module